eukprot:scaffold41379_cov71-Phaeocystis_antarctica.AAC.11
MLLQHPRRLVPEISSQWKKSRIKSLPDFRLGRRFLGHVEDSPQVRVRRQQLSQISPEPVTVLHRLPLVVRQDALELHEAGVSCDWLARLAGLALQIRRPVAVIAECQLVFVQEPVVSTVPVLVTGHDPLGKPAAHPLLYRCDGTHHGAVQPELSREATVHATTVRGGTLRQNEAEHARAAGGRVCQVEAPLQLHELMCIVGAAPGDVVAPMIALLLLGCAHDLLPNLVHALQLGSRVLLKLRLLRNSLGVGRRQRRVLVNHAKEGGRVVGRDCTDHSHLPV